MLLVSACDSGIDKFSLLKRCTVLGDESIIYARAHYVKLFYYFNPNKFSDSYEQISNFDAVTHKNTIDTYTRVIHKIKLNQEDTKDPIVKNLLASCKELSTFSTNFVEKGYPLAINHDSKNAPFSDEFFNEINNIVRFDHNIGIFDKTQTSFRQNVDSYQKAVKDYVDRYRKDIPTEFLKQRGSH